MLNWYRGWLVRQSETVYHPVWWILFFAAILFILAWVMATLPVITSFAGIDAPGLTHLNSQYSQQIIVIPSGIQTLGFHSGFYRLFLFK